MAVVIRTAELRQRLYVPPREAPEAAPGDVPDDEILGVNFFLDYEGADGARSTREIIVRKVERSGGVLRVGAVCLLRKTTRAFRVDRMRMLVHGRTGEVIDDIAGFFGKIAPPETEADRPVDMPPHRRLAPDRSRPLRPPPARLDGADRHTLRAQVRPAAIALMYLARADHDLADAEIAVIADLIEDARAHLGLPETAADAHLLQEMTALLPTANLLTRALRTLVGADFPKDLPARLTRMERADGRAAPEELAAFREIVSTLRRVTA